MSLWFRQSSRPLCHCHRSFSTASCRSASLQWDKNDPEVLKETVPPYPYGPARWYKQSRLGLYGGQRIQFGNNVSDEYEVKTRRSWRPNVFTRKLFSKALNRTVQVRVSARVLRTIDKLGGLDEYLLGEKEARLKQLGESGWWLRWAVMQTPKIKKRFADERREMGLPAAEDIVPNAEVIEHEVALHDESMEAELDDSFHVEKAIDAKPLKFRVGPGQHVMLTVDGWRRTRPGDSVFSERRKAQLAKDTFADYVPQKVEAFEQELVSRLQTDSQYKDAALTESERVGLVKMAKKKLSKELKAKIDELYERRVEAKDNRKAERKAERKVGMGRLDDESGSAEVVSA